MSINSKSTESRKAWNKPEVREVSPAKRTRGGSSFVNDQEDAWYTVS